MAIPDIQSAALTRAAQTRRYSMQRHPAQSTFNGEVPYEKSAHRNDGDVFADRIPGAAFWSQLSRLIGGGVSETYLYPIYGGIVLLAGLVVGCTVVILDEIKSLREEIRRSRGGDGGKE